MAMLLSLDNLQQRIFRLRAGEHTIDDVADVMVHLVDWLRALYERGHANIAKESHCDVCGNSGTDLRTPVEVCRDCYDVAKDGIESVMRQRVAEAVAAEREACRLACVEVHRQWNGSFLSTSDKVVARELGRGVRASYDCAEAVLARGNKTELPKAEAVAGEADRRTSDEGRQGERREGPIATAPSVGNPVKQQDGSASHANPRIADPACAHRDETDDGYWNSPACGKPARWLTCSPVIDAPACDEHKCRCNKPIQKPKEATPCADDSPERSATKADPAPADRGDPSARAQPVMSVTGARTPGLMGSTTARDGGESPALLVLVEECPNESSVRSLMWRIAIRSCDGLAFFSRSSYLTRERAEHFADELRGMIAAHVLTEVRRAREEMRERED